MQLVDYRPFEHRDVALAEADVTGTVPLPVTAAHPRRSRCRWSRAPGPWGSPPPTRRRDPTRRRGRTRRRTRAPFAPLERPVAPVGVATGFTAPALPAPAATTAVRTTPPVPAGIGTAVLMAPAVVGSAEAGTFATCRACGAP